MLPTAAVRLTAALRAVALRLSRARRDSPPPPPPADVARATDHDPLDDMPVVFVMLFRYAFDGAILTARS